MSNGWQEAYSGLTDFIAEHPEVKIGVNKVSIPENVRPEFYRLFNAVRTALIEGRFPALVSEARVLSERYIKVEEGVIKLLGLEDISLSTDLHRFLHNTEDGFSRTLFDSLFNLLKGRVNIEAFEQEVSRIIIATFKKLYSKGYEKWVALSLVRILEPDEIFNVIAPTVSRELKDSLPDLSLSLKKSKNLSLENEPHPVLTVPDIMVHSVRINRFVAFRSGIVMGNRVADSVSTKREWYSCNAIREKYGLLALDLNFMIIYVADKPEDISLIAANKKICRPDLIMECREQKEWYEKEGLEKVKLHQDSLKPTLGTYVVSREAAPERELEKNEVNIHILSVGFDPSKLAPIIDAFIGYTSNDQ